MSDLMQEEFEAWARKRSMDLEYRNFPGVGKFYECPRTLLALDAWQASRECLVIDLEPDDPADEGAAYLHQDFVKERIQSLGLKVKP